MVNYKLIKSKDIPMIEVKTIMKGINKRDMTIEQRYVYEHVSKNTKLTARKSKNMLKDLEALGLHKLKPFYIVKIIDSLPEDKESLKIIVQHSQIAFDEEDINKIMQVVEKYN